VILPGCWKRHPGLEPFLVKVVKNIESEFDKKDRCCFRRYPVGLEDSGPLPSAARLKIAVFTGQDAGSWDYRRAGDAGG